MADKKGPLTPAHIEKVQQGCAHCAEWDKYLAQLETLGIDTSKWREDHAGFSHMFNTIRDQFIPTELR